MKHFGSFLAIKSIGVTKARLFPDFEIGNEWEMGNGHASDYEFRYS